jgi:hypothetical protein
MTSPATLFARFYASIRRASACIYAAFVLVLLVVVYVVVLPWFALAWRVRGPRPSGWHRRDDPRVASLERLRSLF